MTAAKEAVIWKLLRKWRRAPTRRLVAGRWPLEV
jgi:hypothetical protein